MYTATVDLQLDSETTHPAHFLFNIEAAFHGGHKVLSDPLTTTFNVRRGTFVDDPAA
jgi:hypothetical protein